MAVRFYLIPAETIMSGPELRTSPKYVSAIGAAQSGWMSYGAEPTFLVGADVTDLQHAEIVANADITAVPLNLGNTVGANLATVVSTLQGWNIPAFWITAGLTWRQVIRGVGCVFQIASRYQRWGRLFPAGVTLSTTMAELTPAQRDRLRGVADSFGIDYSAVTAATTMAQVIRGLGQQLPAFFLCGEEF